MKTTGGGASEEPSKSSMGKISKKSTKSRSKNTKLETGSKNSVSANLGVPVGSLPATPTHVNMATTPTTPTTSLGNYNLFDASFAVAGHAHGVGVEAANNANRLVSEI